MDKMKTLGAILLASAIGFNGCGRVVETLFSSTEYREYSFCGNIDGDSIITYITPQVFSPQVNLILKLKNQMETRLFIQIFMITIATRLVRYKLKKKRMMEML